MRRVLSRYWRTDQAPVDETSHAKVAGCGDTSRQHERRAERVAGQRHTGKKCAAGDAEPQRCKQAGEAPRRVITGKTPGAEQMPKPQVVGQIKRVYATNGTDRAD